MSMSEALRQMPAQAGRAGVARGEAARVLASDEAEGPRHEPSDTGNPHAALLYAAFTRENLQRAFKCVFRIIVTGRFGIVTAEFGNVTGHFGDVTDGLSIVQ